MEITTLVLLPGMDGTGTLFAPFREAFPADFPITASSGLGALIHDLTLISCTDGWLGSPLAPGGERR